MVAGVPRIVMAAPASRDGRMNPYVLATARKIGITEIYKMGGAQAVAALAFGTETIPKVEKITGPGNIFVTLAKKAVMVTSISICWQGPVANPDCRGVKPAIRSIWRPIC